MKNIIKSELIKLKRYYVIKASFIMMLLSPLLTLFYSTADNGQVWTFKYFAQQTIINNCTLFFPIIITLISGYIISREYKDDTIKNILTIPISYSELLLGKLIIMLILTIFLSFLECIVLLVINIMTGFAGLNFYNFILISLQNIFSNIFIYISVLPIILLFCTDKNFLVGTVISFIYGYFGTFEGKILNYYPIKASIILVNRNCGNEYGLTYMLLPALASLITMIVLSIIIFIITTKCKKYNKLSHNKNR